MWRPSEIAAIVLGALTVGAIRVAQRFDPAFNLTWLWRPHPPWRWDHRPAVALPWLLPALHLLITAALIAGAAVMLLALWRLTRRTVQTRQMRSLRLLLSRDDLAQPLTVGALFDAWAETVQNRYVPWLQGSDPLCLDLCRDADGRLLLYLRGTARTLDALAARLRATWTNIRTQPEIMPTIGGPVAAAVTPRYRDTVTRGFRSYRDYSHSVTESLLAVLDEAPGAAHVQFVLSPRGPRFSAWAERQQRRYEARAQARGVLDPAQRSGLGIGEAAQLQGVVKTAGRQWWRTEIRVVAQGLATTQAMVGALNEAAAENAWVYHRVWFPPVRRRFEAWRRTGMPGLRWLLGCTSLPGVFLATLWQVPTARLRVAGLLREQTRRGPAPRSIPTAAGRGRPSLGVTPVRDEAGGTIAIPAADLRWNALCTGSHGAGKSTVLQQFWRFAAEEPTWAGVLIDPKGALADSARAMVPRDRPCVTWRVGQPSAAWGYNPFLGVTDPDLAVDRLLGAMKQAWTDGSILARSEDILRNTLAAVFDLGWQDRGFLAARQILEDPAAWEQLAGRLHDPDLRAWFGRWARDQRADPRAVIAATAPPLNKLSALTFGARRAAATSSPTSLDLEQLLRDRGLLIVHLATDEVGEDNAALIGILLLAGLWNALRAAHAAEGSEVPTLIVLDETHRFLGETFFRLIAEGRAFGAATAMGLQFVGQLAEPRAQATVRELVQHRFVFRTQNVAEAEEEAKLLARIYANMISPDQELQDVLSFTPDDLFNLPNYRCVSRVLVDGRPQTPFLGETIPPAATGEGQTWGLCPDRWLLHAPSEATAVPEPVHLAGETDGADAQIPRDVPEDSDHAGLAEEDLARLRSRFGAEATESALLALRRRPRGSVRNPVGFAYRAAERVARKDG